MSSADRLKKARGSLGKSQKDMAALLEINYRTYENYEKGLNEPSWAACVAFVKLGFNAEWLLTGEGEMKRGTVNKEQSIAITDPPADAWEYSTQSNRDKMRRTQSDSDSVNIEDVCGMLRRYGNQALIDDIKARIYKIKAAMEG
jgi:DNA-binding XRE family transcriptional regulator